MLNLDFSTWSLPFALAQLCSLVSIVFMFLAVTKKSKTQIAFCQGINAGLLVISNLLLGSIPGAVSNLVATLRNILVAKKLYTKPVMIITLMIATTLGLVFNNVGMFGLFVVAGTAQYTICLYYCKSASSLRYAIIVNCLLWAVHDFYIQNYPMFLVDVGMVLFTSFEIIKSKQK